MGHLLNSFVGISDNYSLSQLCQTFCTSSSSSMMSISFSISLDTKTVKTGTNIELFDDILSTSDCVFLLMFVITKLSINIIT